MTSPGGDKLRKVVPKKGRKRYKCHYEGCNKDFGKNYNLKAHLRMHTGERPFKCTHSTCKKTFMWRSSWISHLAHHKGLPELQAGHGDDDAHEELEEDEDDNAVSSPQSSQQTARRSRLGTGDTSATVPPSTPNLTTKFAFAAAASAAAVAASVPARADDAAQNYSSSAEGGDFMHKDLLAILADTELLQGLTPAQREKLTMHHVMALEQQQKQQHQQQKQLQQPHGQERPQKKAEKLISVGSAAESEPPMSLPADEPQRAPNEAPGAFGGGGPKAEPALLTREQQSHLQYLHKRFERMQSMSMDEQNAGCAADVRAEPQAKAEAEPFAGAEGDYPTRGLQPPVQLPAQGWNSLPPSMRASRQQPQAAYASQEHAPPEEAAAATGAVADAHTRPPPQPFAHGQSPGQSRGRGRAGASHARQQQQRAPPASRGWPPAYASQAAKPAMQTTEMPPAAQPAAAQRTAQPAPQQAGQQAGAASSTEGIAAMDSEQLVKLLLQPQQGKFEVGGELAPPPMDAALFGAQPLVGGAVPDAVGAADAANLVGQPASIWSVEEQARWNALSAASVGSGAFDSAASGKRDDDTQPYSNGLLPNGDAGRDGREQLPDASGYTTALDNLIASFGPSNEEELQSRLKVLELNLDSFDMDAEESQSRRSDAREFSRGSVSFRGSQSRRGMRFSNSHVRSQQGLRGSTAERMTGEASPMVLSGLPNAGMGAGWGGARSRGASAHGMHAHNGGGGGGGGMFGGPGGTPGSNAAMSVSGRGGDNVRMDGSVSGHGNSLMRFGQASSPGHGLSSFSPSFLMSPSFLPPPTLASPGVGHGRVGTFSTPIAPDDPRDL